MKLPVKNSAALAVMRLEFEHPPIGVGLDCIFKSGLLIEDFPSKKVRSESKFCRERVQRGGLQHATTASAVRWGCLRFSHAPSAFCVSYITRVTAVVKYRGSSRRHRISHASGEETIIGT